MMKRLNIANGIFHALVEFYAQDDVFVVPKDFLPHNATSMMSIKPNGEHGDHAPDDEHGQINHVRQSVSDLPNVVNSIPDSSKRVQGYGQRVAFLVGVVGSAQGKEETE